MILFSRRIRKPSFSMFLAAFKSRSMVCPQCGQTHERSFNVSSLNIVPQWPHFLEDGKNRPMKTAIPPFLSAFLASMFANYPNEQSPIDLERCLLDIIPLTLRFSRQMIWFSSVSLFESLFR